MARIRSIKPQLYANEVLASASAHARLLFIGTWTLADRAGRLEDRPIRIKGELFPYEDIDVDALLDELASKGFIRRYKSGRLKYIQINTFEKHQRPHPREPKSDIPPPTSSRIRISREVEKAVERNGEALPGREKVLKETANTEGREGDLRKGMERERVTGSTKNPPSQASALSDSLPVTDEQIRELQADPLYEHLGVGRVKRKFGRYHGREPSYRELVGWLNREKGNEHDDHGSTDQIRRVARKLGGDH